MSKKGSHKTFRNSTKYESSQPLLNDDRSTRKSSSLLGQAVLESPTSSVRSEGKRTNEELQATMIQVLKSIEMISLETKGEVSRLCTFTENLQTRLDLEFSTPKGAQGGVMSQATSGSEPVIPLFPLFKEEKDRGKKREVLEGSQPIIEPFLEKKFPSFPLLSFNNRKQSEQERTRYGMPIMTGESSGKESFATSDKPPPYRPPPLANKGGGANWRKPE
ncbi:hypothetical protein ACFX2J_004214 [Malus domestica]